MAPQPLLEHFLIQFIKGIALEEAGGSPASPGAFHKAFLYRVHYRNSSGGGWWLPSLSCSISSYNSLRKLLWKRLVAPPPPPGAFPNTIH